MCNACGVLSARTATGYGHRSRQLLDQLLRYSLHQLLRPTGSLQPPLALSFSWLRYVQYLAVRTAYLGTYSRRGNTKPRLQSQPGLSNHRRSSSLQPLEPDTVNTALSDDFVLIQNRVQGLMTLARKFPRRSILQTSQPYRGYVVRLRFIEHLASACTSEADVALSGARSNRLFAHFS